MKKNLWIVVFVVISTVFFLKMTQVKLKWEL
jgi:hypothetical protein